MCVYVYMYIPERIRTWLGFCFGFIFLNFNDFKRNQEEKGLGRAQVGVGGGGKEQSIGISQDIGFKEGGKRRKYREKKGPSR